MVDYYNFKIKGFENSKCAVIYESSVKVKPVKM